jgi:hypothetical protein
MVNPRMSRIAIGIRLMELQPGMKMPGAVQPPKWVTGRRRLHMGRGVGSSVDTSISTVRVDSGAVTSKSANVWEHMRDLLENFQSARPGEFHKWLPDQWLKAKLEADNANKSPQS